MPDGMLQVAAETERGLALAEKSLNFVKDAVRSENAALYGTIGVGLAALLGTGAVLAGGLPFAPLIAVGVLIFPPAGILFARWRANRQPPDEDEVRRKIFALRTEEIEERVAQRALLSSPEDAPARADITSLIGSLLLMDVPALQARYDVAGLGRGSPPRLPGPRSNSTDEA